MRGSPRVVVALRFSDRIAIALTFARKVACEATVTVRWARQIAAISGRAAGLSAPIALRRRSAGGGNQVSG